MRVRDIPSKLKDIINDLDIDSEKMIGYQIIPRLNAGNKVLFRVFYKNSVFYRGTSRDYIIVAEDGLAYNLTDINIRDFDYLNEVIDNYIPWYEGNREELWRDYSYYKNLEED